MYPGAASDNSKGKTKYSKESKSADSSHTPRSSLVKQNPLSRTRSATDAGGTPPARVPSSLPVSGLNAESAGYSEGRCIITTDLNSVSTTRRNDATIHPHRLSPNAEWDTSSTTNAISHGGMRPSSSTGTNSGPALGGGGFPPPPLSNSPVLSGTLSRGRPGMGPMAPSPSYPGPMTAVTPRSFPNQTEMRGASSSSSASSFTSSSSAVGITGGGVPSTLPNSADVGGYKKNPSVSFPTSTSYALGDNAGNGGPPPPVSFQRYMAPSANIPFPSPHPLPPSTPPNLYPHQYYHQHSPLHSNGMNRSSGGVAGPSNAAAGGQFSYHHPGFNQPYPGMIPGAVPPSSSAGPPSIPQGGGASYPPPSSPLLCTTPVSHSYPGMPSKTPDPLTPASDDPTKCLLNDSPSVGHPPRQHHYFHHHHHYHNHQVDEEDRANEEAKEFKTLVYQLQDELQRERDKQKTLRESNQYYRQQHANTILEINAALHAYRHDVVLLLHVLERVLSFSVAGQRASRGERTPQNRNEATLQASSSTPSRPNSTEEESLQWLSKILEWDTISRGKNYIRTHDKNTEGGGGGASLTLQPRGKSTVSNTPVAHPSSFLPSASQCTENGKMEEAKTSQKEDLVTIGRGEKGEHTATPSNFPNEVTMLGALPHDGATFALPLPVITSSLLTPPVKSLSSALRLRFETESWDISLLYGGENTSRDGTDPKEEIKLLTPSVPTASENEKSEPHPALSSHQHQFEESNTSRVATSSDIHGREELANISTQRFLEEELRQVATEVQQNLQVYMESLNYGFSSGISSRRPLVIQIPVPK